MRTLKIAKRIKMPKIAHFPIEPLPVVPWGRMEVGNSVFFNDEGRENVALREAVCRLAYDTKRKLGKQFSVRTVNGGVRMWRVA